MSKKDKDPFWQSSDEIGYGKPPVHSRFVKGQSGNPKGRPKKPATKSPPITDPSSRDRFLANADSKVTIREGEAIKDTTVAAAIERQLSVSALKGNSHAAKVFLDREESLRKELIAEIDADHHRWQEHQQELRCRLETGRDLPDHLPHPDDIVFEYGQHVKFRGGEPVIANKNRAFMVELRDILILQTAKDNRDFRAIYGKSKQRPHSVADILIIQTNSGLPQRLQIDDLQTIVRTSKAECLRKKTLARKVDEAWKALGIPGLRDFVNLPVLPLLAEFGMDISQSQASK